jgi:hypothetical protein
LEGVLQGLRELRLGTSPSAPAMSPRPTAPPRARFLTGSRASR